MLAGNLHALAIAANLKERILILTPHCQTLILIEINWKRQIDLVKIEQISPNGITSTLIDLSENLPNMTENLPTYHQIHYNISIQYCQTCYMIFADSWILW